VGGGVKAVERRRFEIPKKSWHGFCLVGIRQRSGGKAGRRKKGFALEVKKIPVEEDGISNRQDSTTFVPPLTTARHEANRRVLQMRDFSKLVINLESGSARQFNVECDQVEFPDLCQLQGLVGIAGHVGVTASACQEKHNHRAHGYFIVHHQNLWLFTHNPSVAFILRHLTPAFP
jgi:hypothetical protein